MARVTPGDHQSAHTVLRMLLFMSLLFCCSGQSAGYNDEVFTPGDIVLGGLFAVQNHDGTQCSGVSASSVQGYEAVRWFLTELNKRDFIQNVTLGFNAFKTCGQVTLAVKSTLELINNQKGGVNAVGLIGPGRSSEAQVVSRLLSSLPEIERLTQIVYSATADSLSDKNIYKNLFRVIVPDNLQVEIISQLLVSLKWNYIAIVYENDDYGQEAANDLRRRAESMGICVPAFEAVDSGMTETEKRSKFSSIATQLEAGSESTILGLVFIGQSDTGKSMLKHMDIQLDQFQVIASEAIQSSLDNVRDAGTIYTRAKGLLTSGPPIYPIRNFRLHWEQLHRNATVMREVVDKDEWLLKYMSEQTECDLAGQQSISSNCVERSSKVVDEEERSVYVSYALLAATAFAQAVKEVHSDLCGEGGGMCADMRRPDRHSLVHRKLEELSVDPKMFPELEGFELTFGFKDGEIDLSSNQNYSDYIVSNLQKCDAGLNTFCYVKVGDFKEGQLLVNRDDIKSYSKTGVEHQNAVQAQCQPNFQCTSCQPSPTDGEVLHIPGDYYIIGLIPIHSKGDQLYQCGDIRTTISVDLVEALVFAVERANNKKQTFLKLLGDKKIGLIVVDTCLSPLLTKERVIKFFRGDLVIGNGVTSAQLKDNVVAFVGPYGSSNSVPISTVMSDIDKLYISFSSTSSRLSDKKMFPNFMRTCSPDNKQADYIMNIAKSLGSKYVQIIHTDEEYGVAGRDSLENAAKKHGVCIAQSVSVPEGDDSKLYIGIIADLRKFKHARLVVIFVRSHVTSHLLKILNQEIDTGEFVFIGGENWARRTAVIENNPKVRGSLTLTQELPKDTAFENYYNDLELASSNNPWLQEYLEIKHECYFPSSFNKRKFQENTPAKECTPSLLFTTKDTDTWVPFAINAAYALILGFNKTMSTKCFGFNTLCSEFTTKELISNVKNVRLDIYNDNVDVRVFDDNGEGDVGYVISQVVVENNRLIYRKVEPSVKGKLSSSDLDQGHLVDFSSKCQNDRECGVCKLQFGQSDNVQEDSEAGSSTAIGLGVTVGILVVLVIILLVLLCRCNRQRKKEDLDPGYLTVVPDMHSKDYQLGVVGSDGRVCNIVPEGTTD